MKSVWRFFWLALPWFFFGCATLSPDPATLTPAYKNGKADGCRTAQGDYAKDHERFQTDTAYHEGWFAGRRECNPDNRKAND